jgi:glycolate oxidase iron-sulfur subunit
LRTEFSAELLQQPDIAEVDPILRSCVHCGFCTATCPTYVIGGDERDSPRGRIYLIKEMFERGGKPDDAVTRHVDRCLSCLSCMTTCPSGVDYMRLVDLARARIEPAAKRPLGQKITRALITRVAPYPGRFRLAMAAARLAQPLVPLLAKLRLKEMAAMMSMARGRKVSLRSPSPGFIPASGRAEMTVGLMMGCVGPALNPDIDEATLRILDRHGVNVVIAKNQGCCGALSHHMGKEDAALDFARRQIDAWEAAQQERKLDAIAVNVSGCGTTLKDYGRMLAHDPDYADRARHFASLVRDISEVLHGLGALGVEQSANIKVAYHPACSLSHGQRVTAEPRALLRRAGFTVAEIPESHLCCGSAGVYNILQPDTANALRARKQAAIAATGADVVAAGNIGCMTQLETGLGIPIVHTVQLLDWATGGPCPPSISHLADRATPLRSGVAPAA